jgi:hypothetical protein
MNTFKKFTCAECGGTADMLESRGRTMEYARGYSVPIPDGFMIPTCLRCGELYIIPEIEVKLFSTLKARFLQMQAEHYRELVDILVRRHWVKQQDIVRTCGVTPAYFSHVLNGKRAASTTLTRLLEAFVACGSEFVRHLEGRHWSQSKIGIYAVKMPHIQESVKKAAWGTEGSATTSHWATRSEEKGSSSAFVGQAA